jgi:hypothetical protein
MPLSFGYKIRKESRENQLIAKIPFWQRKSLDKICLLLHG